MDFSLEYTKEQEEFAREVREWLDQNYSKDMDRPREPRKMSHEVWQKRRELGRKLGEKGWLFPDYPRQYGGGGLEADLGSVLSQELAQRGLGMPPYYDIAFLAAPGILACGTEEQKKRFLPPMLRGEVITWQLFTEPEAGTDEANQQTNALRHVREKDHFIVSGSKIFVGAWTNQQPPDQFWLLTRSDLEAPRHQNLAMFIAPANLPGITIVPLDLFVPEVFGVISGPTIDYADGDKNSVFFDEVKIHESYLIGGEKDGWSVTNATLDVEHGGGGVRVPQENTIVEKFLAQCKSNPNVAKRLRENPQLLESVVDIYIGAQIGRLWGLRGAGGIGAHYQGPQIILHSKMYGAKFIADIAKVLGPYALTDDDEWGLDEGIFEVGQRGGICLAPGGTPEATKIIMSRLLGIGR